MSDWLNATDDTNDDLPIIMDDPYADPYDGGAVSAPPAQMAPSASATIPAAAPAPAAPAHGYVPTDGELNVQAPHLEHVNPGVRTVGGTRSDLSTLVLDVEVPVEVYFGDAALTVEEFLDLGAGSVVELDHTIEAPIELRVRGKLVAHGQLVTINGNYGLRITDMVQ